MAHYLVEKNVREFVHGRGKQITGDGLDALDRAVEAVLDRAIHNLNHHTRLTAFEVEFAAGLKPELTAGLKRRK